MVKFEGGEANVKRLYISSMQTLQVHTERTITSSDSSTHLLPVILACRVSGVNSAISSAVMKFDPPPNIILLMETTRSVYHGMTLIITQSSVRSFLIPCRRVCDALSFVYG